MQSLADFLSEKGISDVNQDEDYAFLQVVLLRSDESTVTIGFLNSQFVLARDDIKGVTELESPMPNPFGEGVPCRILVSRDADLVQTQRLKVSAVLQHVPFAVSRPSWVPTNVPGPLYTPRERDWFEARGIDVEANIDPQRATTTYTDTQSQQSTTTRTVTGNGADNPVDDTPGDGYTRDDQNSDDLNNDP